jgi:arylsulfatase A-like enzyme
MLTGLPPEGHRALENHASIGDVPTVATALRERGFRTGAFVSAHVLSRASGLDHGFDVYDDLLGTNEHLTASALGSLALGRLLSPSIERRGDHTVDRALAWLRASEGRAFLWVHLYDPHTPYAAPEPWTLPYDPARADAPGGPDDVRIAKQGGEPWDHLLVGNDLRAPIARYAGEIAWTDALVGKLVDGLPPDAAIVLAADHGESLLEHGELLSHGSQLFETTLRTPIVVVGPGVARGSVDDRPVALERVAGTLLALAGAPAERTLADPGTDGIWSFTFGEQSRPRVTPTSRRVALREGAWKWHVRADGTVGAHDLATDPGERVDLSGLDPARTAAVRARGLERLATLAGVAIDPGATALGYVSD